MISIFDAENLVEVGFSNHFEGGWNTFSTNYGGTNQTRWDELEAGFSFEKLKKSPKHISILIKRANSEERKKQGDSIIDWEMLEEYRLPSGMVENIGKNKYKDEINKHWKQF